MVTINKRDYVIRKFKITNYEAVHVNSDGTTQKIIGSALGDLSRQRLEALIKKEHGSNCILMSFETVSKKFAILKDKFIDGAIMIAEGKKEND